MRNPDAVVVGAGPNGLTAAIILAKSGLRVQVYEAASTPGGGTRTAELTVPGVLHDVCSAVHPLGVASPVFQSFRLQDFGLEWIHPRYPLVHPLDGGKAAVLERSLRATAERLGADAAAYHRLFENFTENADALLRDFLGPVQFPVHPFLYARFGLKALRSAETLARSYFKGESARALFAGMAAHSFLALDETASAAVGLMLGLAGHAYGWPIARGGSQSITSSLVACLKHAAGEIMLNHRITSWDQLPAHCPVLFDVTPQQLLKICGDRFPLSYQKRLQAFEYGPGIFKLDWTLSARVPWLAAAAHETATLHLGGNLEEIAASESAMRQGKVHPRPFVLIAQPSVVDASRTRDGRSALWGYCHVPPYSSEDMTDRIEAQIERFAPGFQKLIIARHRMFPADFEAYNGNYIGGSISGGLMNLRQTLQRPRLFSNPYATPDPRIFLCSSSTPPGPGVHGMCGWHAALAVLGRR
ncbi:MAG TPA: NAD(P)/FAD-dependent oxidoreductase [Oligoflexus sp.]|uniref:phytoene desaturase family protein n=1 Tax=Oligoflexus sp. TaxID=1971216 RepID=UPI002D7F84AD|nr:NAD(P)/FAD-dependent oxidoreductase [Oligoflexus sp.]HET9236525.1 NAD(P)/FAD-dependent oxidoreductase [Oligoflexus sp.]